MGRNMRALLFLFLLGLPAPAAARRTPEAPPISDEEAWRIGQNIWRNESGGSTAGLTSWNFGEEFASLGIGHFIWFPVSYHGPFQQSFPMLVEYLEKNGALVPEWLLLSPECPWSSREEFLAAKETPRMRELRFLLESTVRLQARFAAERLRGSLPKMLSAVSKRRRPRIQSQFERVWRQPGGVYVLVDYANFKGEGTHLQERYGRTGWGLLQVLERMERATEGPEALSEFAASARSVLIRRVRLSPPERRESRWLRGWLSRLKTYSA
ncbi:MAG: hypothetical protein A2X36_03390 [Elusimicrobia bacterium GWA2_69_24]|nr:MAG: hypothetical protein A2X36_03390 [Elusimicrobia bacterium GWA2_69_24]